MVYSENDVCPDSEKVNDPRNKTPPTYNKELQEFLSFLTYLLPFISNLVDKTYILRNLLKKEATFQWEELHSQCFENLETEISQNSTISYFDMSNIPTLQTDASLKGRNVCIERE